MAITINIVDAFQTVLHTDGQIFTSDAQMVEARARSRNCKAAAQASVALPKALGVDHQKGLDL